MNQDLTNAAASSSRSGLPSWHCCRPSKRAPELKSTSRLRNVDAVFTEIRKRGAQMKDLENSEEHQHEKIESLKRRIEKKDAFLDLLNKS
ncbi:hypothetical protein L596_026102 [Steinernema carpocapsae]|uniref:Uncharacterized protein n=1 Tax=Steinernema carpocapsae TaxID=34508 RepID=A0A4U5M0E9_STECR|nr:hypothetical protein L596_026102 [Steinernema carpocapsae]